MRRAGVWRVGLAKGHPHSPWNLRSRLPKKQLKRKPKDGGSAAAAAAAASSTRTKQHELVCKECVLLKESKGEPVEMSKMPKSGWYCGKERRSLNGAGRVQWGSMGRYMVQV